MNVRDFQPKDVQTALRLALRFERAKLILAEGYTFSVDEEMQTVYICKPGRLFAHYIIYQGQCDCPDFTTHRDFCKHTLAYALRQEEDAQCEAYERMIADCEVVSTGCDQYARY